MTIQLKAILSNTFNFLYCSLLLDVLQTKILFYFSSILCVIFHLETVICFGTQEVGYFASLQVMRGMRVFFILF